MTETKHTPRPWYIEDGLIKNWEMLIASTYSADASLAQANAAHIVKCVNMHDELVEALKALHLQALQSSVNDTSNDYGCEALDLAYTALKKAGAL